MASSGMLRPEDLLPGDWGLLSEHLGRLGRETAYVGGVALTIAFDAAQEAALVAESFRVARSSPGYSAAGAVDAVERGLTPNAADVARSADHAVMLAQKAVDILEDALKSSPRYDFPQKFELPPADLSDFAATLRHELRRRDSEA